MREGRLVRALATGAVVLALLTPGVSAAQAPAAPVLDWETGAGKSYAIPAVEIPAFILG